MKESSESTKSNGTGLDFSDDEYTRAIPQAVRSVRYGAVEVVIHDSRVVQIECKEKIRFPAEGSKKER